MVARSVQGLESIEGVLSFIKSRAVAEDRYEISLRALGR